MIRSQRLTPTRTTPEHALLVDLCRRDLPDQSVLLERLRSMSITKVLDIAARHGVAGVVGSRVARLDRSRADLLELERGMRRRHVLMQELERVAIRQLRARGVDPVVSKGNAIARFYDRPEHRVATDLDVLVDRRRLDDAVDVLASIGYETPARSLVRETYLRSHFHLPLHRHDRHVIELHWGFSRPRWPFGLDASLVRRQASVDPEDPDGPRHPAPEHLVLIVVLQVLQEGLARLSRIVDLDRVIRGTPDLRWNEMIAHALDGGLRSALAVSLRLCKILLDTPVPPEVERAIRPNRVTRAQIAIERPVETLLTRRLEFTWASRLLVELWLTDRARDAWRRLIEEWRLDAESEALFGSGVGRWRLLARMPKLPARQLLSYVGTIGRNDGGHRSHTRFWSSQASSSDFL